jgi:hypothetical protein
MDSDGESQRMQIEQNNPIKVPTENTNNVSGSKKSKNEEYLSKDLSKYNQFMFTPLESFLLNKKMPHGFKFETEENILKTLELSKNNQRRVKPKGFLQEPKIVVKSIKTPLNLEKKVSAEKLNSSKTIKKPKKEEKETVKEINPKSNINNNTNINSNTNKIETNNSEAYKVRIKCTTGLNKIKSSTGATIFYISSIPDAPCLANIEKKINNFEYKSLNECFDDIRKLWNYQFKNHAKEPNIYQNICKLSSYTENVFKELLNEKNTFNEKKEEISSIKKRAQKLKKDLDEFNGNTQKEIYNKNIKPKNSSEISKLSDRIRTLSKQQLRGIIQILWDKSEMTDKKTFEFDLDKLSSDKFQKLENYVNKCCSDNSKTNIINKNMINKKENKSNGINNNSIKKNGNINNNGIHKNNINHQSISKNEESKKLDNSFSNSDSMSSNSSLY